MTGGESLGVDSGSPIKGWPCKWARVRTRESSSAKEEVKCPSEEHSLREGFQESRATMRPRGKIGLCHCYFGTCCVQTARLILKVLSSSLLQIWMETHWCGRTGPLEVIWCTFSTTFAHLKWVLNILKCLQRVHFLWWIYSVWQEIHFFSCKC